MNKLEVLAETSTQMKNSLVDHICFVIRNIGWILPQVRNTMASGKKGERRSLGDDLLKINERFRTKIEIEGEENIPTEGGLILAMAHLVNTKTFPGWENKKVNPTWWLVGITQALRKRRGKEAEFRLIFKFLAGTEFGRFWKKLISIYGGLPVNPKAPKESLNSLKQATEAAKDGEIILIAPEGETHVALTSAKRGIARLALSDCPFLPLVYAETSTGQGFKYTIRIGKPIYSEGANQWQDLPRSERKKKEIEFANTVMNRIAALIPKNQRGVYEY